MVPSVVLSQPPQVLAAIPHLLGFHPERSLVLLWIEKKSVVLVQRVDLPQPSMPAGQVQEWARHVCAPQCTITADSVLAALYLDSAVQSAAVGHLVDAVIGLLQPEVIDVLYAGVDGWSDSSGRHHEWGQISRSHRPLGPDFGPEPLASRQALSLAPLAPINTPSCRPPGTKVQRTAVAILTRCASADAVVTDRELTTVLRGLRETTARDRVCEWLVTGNPSEASRAWGALVVRTPQGWAAPLAAVTALASWLAGDGARAWCAIDRALADDPHYSLAVLMREVVSVPVPPATVREWLVQYRPTFAAPD